MLEALASRKDGRIFSDSSNVQAHQDGRIDGREDFITSAVFGPLRFLPTSGVWNFVKSTLLASGKGGGIDPRSHEVEFWPSLRHAGHRVEPDLLLTFWGNDEIPLCVVCVEAKWGWRPGDDELARQVIGQQRAVQERYVGCVNIHHVVVSRVFHDIEVPNVNCVTWRELSASSTIFGFAASQDVVGWLDMVKRALLRLGESPVPPLAGFNLDEFSSDLKPLFSFGGAGGAVGWSLFLPVVLPDADEVFAASRFMQST